MFLRLLESCVKQIDTYNWPVSPVVLGIPVVQVFDLPGDITDHAKYLTITICDALRYRPSPLSSLSAAANTASPPIPSIPSSAAARLA